MRIGELGENLIFILSQPRSGSTLLQRIIARHADVHTTAEPWLLLPLIYTLRSDGHQAEYDANLAHIALTDFLGSIPGGILRYKHEIRRTAVAMYNAAVITAGKLIFLDKTPRYYFIIPELYELFPQAKFICLYRHPLAILNSILETRVKKHWILLARYHHDLVTAPFKLLAAADFLSTAGYTFRYEDLVADPVEQVSRLFAFLQLDFDPEYLNYASQAPPSGKMGDQSTIHAYQEPVSERSDRWQSAFTGAHEQHYARAYADQLGKETFTRLGYPYEHIDQLLTHFTGEHIPPEESWQALMSPRPANRERLFYAELALLEHRRLTQKLKNIFRRSK
jgi:hypothetical protein